MAFRDVFTEEANVVRRVVALVFAGLLLVLTASPVFARADGYFTETCSGGFLGTVHYYPDGNALGGQNTANAVYNQVNPLGETCSAD
jgi:hypothetical protein